MSTQSEAPIPGAHRPHALACSDLPSEAQLLALALAVLPAFWLALRVLGLKRCLAWLADHRRPSERGETPADALDRARYLGLIVNVASAYALGPVTCLSRSLLLIWMLGREGLGAELRIGVRMTDGALAAHAWVEAGGVPVNDARDVAREFVPFADGLTQRPALVR